MAPLVAAPAGNPTPMFNSRSLAVAAAAAGAVPNPPGQHIAPPSTQPDDTQHHAGAHSSPGRQRKKQRAIHQHLQPEPLHHMPQKRQLLQQQHSYQQQQQQQLPRQPHLLQKQKQQKNSRPDIPMIQAQQQQQQQRAAALLQQQLSRTLQATHGTAGLASTMEGVIDLLGAAAADAHQGKMEEAASPDSDAEEGELVEDR